MNIYIDIHIITKEKRMINVTVINMRSLTKYIAIACILVCLVYAVKIMLEKKTTDIPENGVELWLRAVFLYNENHAIVAWFNRG